MSVFELPQEWIETALENISEISGGGTPSRSNPAYFSGDVYWATPTDITALNSLWIEETKERITQAALENSSVKLLPVGSVLMTSRATIGVTAIARHPITTNQGFVNFTCNEQLLNNEYLAYWLPLIKPRLLQFAGGTTFKEIGRSTLRKFKIPLPPLPEQKRIVTILREADEIRRLRQQANEKHKEFLQSVFFELFGNPDPKRNDRKWKIVKLENLVEVGTGGTPSRSNSSFYGGSYAWVKTTELRDNVITTTEETITDSGLKFSNTKIYPKNTILLAMYGQGQTRGRTAKLGIPAATNQACAAFLPSNELLPNYLWYWFQNSYENVRSLARGGSQANLNLSILKNLRVPKPNIDLQQKFEELVDEHLQLEALSATSLDRIDDLFKSLLVQAFNGELTASWREQHREELATAAAERDRLLNATQPAIQLAIEEQAIEALEEVMGDRPPSDHPRYQLLRELSHEQQRLYQIVTQQTGYFTAESLSNDEENHLSLTTARRGLQLLTESGLVISVSLPIEPTSGTAVYVPVHRQPKPTDEIRLADLALLEGNTV